METSYYGDNANKKKQINKGLSAVQQAGGNANVSNLLGKETAVQAPKIQKLPGTTQEATAQTAYTPKGTYNDAALSAEDSATMDGYAKAWQAAQAAGNREMMDYWHNKGEELRAGYGYSGGTDGSEYIPVTIIDEDGNKKSAVAANDTLSMLQGLYAQEQNRANTYYDNAKAEADAQLKAQQAAINQQYDDLAKQHYVDRELAYRDLPQQLAALGHTGGLAESSLLGISYDYENNLNAAERARSQQLTEQQDFYAQALRDAALQKAEMDSNAALQHYNFYQQAMAEQRAAEQAALENQRYNDEWAYQKEQDALQLEAQKRAEALGLVESMLAAKLTPTADMIAAAYGLTPEQAAAYVTQIQNANAPKYYYTETPETEPTPEFSTTGLGTTPQQTGASMKPSEWSYVMNNVKTNVGQNNTEAVKQYMEILRDDGDISAAQWNELADYLETEGWTNVPRY